MSSSVFLKTLRWLYWDMNREAWVWLLAVFCIREDPLRTGYVIYPSFLKRHLVTCSSLHICWSVLNYRHLYSCSQIMINLLAVSLWTNYILGLSLLAYVMEAITNTANEHDQLLHSSLSTLITSTNRHVGLVAPFQVMKQDSGNLLSSLVHG